MSTEMKNQSGQTFRKCQHGDETCMGYSELKDNCWNFSIVSINPNLDVWANEYYAGLIQGQLQGEDMLKASRNNTWKNTYLCDPEKTFVKTLPPSDEVLDKAKRCLVSNLKFLLDFIMSHNEDKYATAFNRLLCRMCGIYDGATCERTRRRKRSFQTGNSLLKTMDIVDFLSSSLHYGDSELTPLDVYFINAQMDMFDVLSGSLEGSNRLYKADHCSAFVKRTKDDIYWTHNSWCGFLSQSHTISYAIRNDEGTVDFITQNSYCPGQFGSNMDFGFNGHGICFNETTHRYSHSRPKEKGIWLCWRAAAAEMFATSTDDFLDYLKIDNTGTYLNGYMVIDANSNETSLIEMSYRRFVKFDSTGTSVTVKEYAGNEERVVGIDEYDNELITPEYILGINYPISNAVAEDLQSTDNRPMRRIQFKERIGTVSGMNTAKQLITYVGPEEPLSVYGRWDLGYGTTEYPRTIPDGAVDAKAFSVNRVREVLKDLQFKPNEYSQKTTFWMLYGTPVINGSPFVWSKSQWAEYHGAPEKNFVPDELSGAWNETKLFMD